MKYIKTYENQITIKIESDAQENLLLFAVENNKINLIKTLLKKGVNPNILNRHKTPILFVLLSELSPNLELIKMFLNSGSILRFNDDQYIKHLFHTIFNTNKKYEIKLENFIKILPLLIKAGSKLNITNKHDNKLSSYPNPFPTFYDNFFDMLDSAIRWELITKQTYERILNIIKKEAPQEYKHYLLSIDANKYNI